MILQYKKYLKQNAYADYLTRKDAETKLKEKFGIEHFYDEQWKSIERILRGERILMIERTGFGKSLCYQFPATVFDGVTVVFSPLIALMRDQVRGLLKKAFLQLILIQSSRMRIIKKLLDVLKTMK